MLRPKRFFLLEISGLLLAALVLFLVHSAYSKFSEIGLIRDALSRYQQELRLDIQTVHLLVHEKPVDETQVSSWKTRVRDQLSHMQMIHGQVMGILHAQNVAFDLDLHNAMSISLESLVQYGELMLGADQDETLFRQADEAFDQVYDATLALLQPHQEEVESIIDAERNLIQEHFEDLMTSLLAVFVLTLVMLAWYQHRARQLHLRLQEQIRAGQAVTENLVDGVLTMDAGGNILSANPMIGRILGYSPEELTGQPIEILMAPEHQGKHGSYVSSYITTGVKKIIGMGRKLRARRKDGSLIPIYLGVSEYMLDGRRCFAGVVRDISSELAHEQELLRARDLAEAGSRAKSEFLSSMTHEVRTPLNGVMGALSLLRMESEGKQKEYVDLAYSSSVELLKLLEAVLEYSRMEQQVVDVNPLTINVSNFCNELLDFHHADTEKKHLSAALDIATGVPEDVLVDALRLRQILDHLISNAIKFTPQGGYRVDVGMRSVDGCSSLRFTVSDTGVGIAPEHHEDIFLAFKQVDGSLTRQYGGIGLGLAICKRLAKALGAELTVESEPGKGSRFHLNVPVGVASLAEEASAPLARGA